MDLVRQHLLANIACVLHDDLGPSLSGLALQLSAFNGEEADRSSVRAALEHSVETVRILQYLAHAGLAARFGLRRAFELLPYCAAPASRDRVQVLIAGRPPWRGEAAQRGFEQAAVALAEATRDYPTQSFEVRLDDTGWSLERKEAA